MRRRRLSAEDLEAILGVTSRLAAPVDLATMLFEVAAAGRQILKADRGTVWLYDAGRDDLVTESGTGVPAWRVRAGTGLVGACARSRVPINVPDCQADPRFDPAVDRATGYRTRCMLDLPLVDRRDALVGVMQVLNKAGGAFDRADEDLGTCLPNSARWRCSARAGPRPCSRAGARGRMSRWRAWCR